jgi:hypothetical protein
MRPEIFGITEIWEAAEMSEQSGEMRHIHIHIGGQVVIHWTGNYSEVV